MTFDQLSMFVAVAEREHLTQAAAAIGRTASAVSASVKALETQYNVRLFHRVGRRIELTETGRTFLNEAKAALARARSASLVLSELAGMKRGTLEICASQTIASYWLPSRLVRFHRRHPGIEIRMTVGNTKSVSESVSKGLVELGFIEGTISDPALLTRHVAEDAMVVVVSPNHPLARDDKKKLTLAALIAGTAWVRNPAREHAHNSKPHWRRRAAARRTLRSR
jgi:DNA-binding transcriptional LysR family regulator